MLRRRCSSGRVALVATGLLLMAVSSFGPVRAADREQGIGDFPKLSAESDWPWWRGPTRNGYANVGAALPTTWSDSNNVAWKTPLPGRGHSSPVLVGDRVLLTTADTSQQIHSVLALSRSTGKLLWKTDVSRGGFPARNHPKNTEATSTVACDGERLFASFFHHEKVEVFALELNGKVLWQRVAGPFNPKRYEYGYAPSPLIYQGTVIIAAEYDGDSFLTALDRRTGQPVWKTPRPGNITFSSPVVAHVGGRDQLLISGADQVASYDPATGKPLWSTPGTAAATCGTIVWEGDVVVASGGYPKSETLAIRADGSRTVLWRNQQKCYEQSMLIHGGHVYALTDNGILFCWRLSDGQEKWKQRLRGPISSSPILAAGNIYWTNEYGTTYVFKPNPDKFELVAENQLGAEGFASPAASGERLYIRTATGSGASRQEFLYCLGR